MKQQNERNEQSRKPRIWNRLKRRPGRIRSGIRFRQTLLSRYMFIIVFAFCFVPVIFPLTSVAYLVFLSYTEEQPDYLKYGSSQELETMWHQEASQLTSNQPEAIDRRLQELKQRYPEASMFWVDAAGGLRLQLPVQEQLPQQWTAADAIRFMKTHVNSDPFTVVAFLGGAELGDSEVSDSEIGDSGFGNSGVGDSGFGDLQAGDSGFMTIQLPRSIIEINRPIGTDTPFFITFIFIMFVFFVLLSLLFFRGIRRRLLRLQAAMAVQGDHGLPDPIVITRADEIGQLEESFNDMIEQLAESREREQAEMELRKQLIANLSHDLRTPLTVMNSHVYALRDEPLSEKAQASVQQIEHKIKSIDGLMDNLLSYTLMTSGRYPLTLEPVDMLRLVRECAAAWYPLWEQAGITPDIELPEEESVIWELDKQGFRRVLDNLFQNIVRHARDGQYIGLTTSTGSDGQIILVISDRGPGLSAGLSGKGAGIGLAIVDYLVSEMGLVCEKASMESGTRILLYSVKR